MYLSQSNKNSSRYLTVQGSTDEEIMGVAFLPEKKPELFLFKYIHTYTCFLYRNEKSNKQVK